MVLAFEMGSFLGGWIFEAMSVRYYYWLIIITEPLRATTEAQSAQRTHRDFFGRGFGAVSGLPILAGCGLAAPGSPSTVPHPCRGPWLMLVARCPWAGPSGLAAMSSGQAGLPGKRSCPVAGDRLG